MPFLTAFGLLIYALSPVLFRGHEYMGLLLGTVLFSVAAGLNEVLLSPLIAALPSEHPERDMSILHSLYAWGVLLVVCISTLFFNLFGVHNWMYLTLFLALFPALSGVLYLLSPIPEISLGHSNGGGGEKRRRVGLMLCAACIFLGSAAENVMTNWISGFMENALHISKMYGDLLGLALFATLLGLGRTLYAKYGRNIEKNLPWGMLGAAICYLTAALCNNPFVALIACVLTGFCTSMLWPGTLILMEEKIAAPGISAYALMAAGGDFGASVAPQLMGVAVDVVSESGFAKALSATLSLTPEQIGMKTGMLITAIFPILGILVVLIMKRYFRRNKDV